MLGIWIEVATPLLEGETSFDLAVLKQYSISFYLFNNFIEE